MFCRTSGTQVRLVLVANRWSCLPKGNGPLMSTHLTSWCFNSWNDLWISRNILFSQVKPAKRVFLLGLILTLWLNCKSAHFQTFMHHLLPIIRLWNKDDLKDFKTHYVKSTSSYLYIEILCLQLHPSSCRNGCMLLWQLTLKHWWRL